MPLFWLDSPRFFMKLHVVDSFFRLLEIHFVYKYRKIRKYKEQSQKQAENKKKQNSTIFENSENFHVGLPGSPRGLPGATRKFLEFSNFLDVFVCFS